MLVRSLGEVLPFLRVVSGSNTGDSVLRGEVKAVDTNQIIDRGPEGRFLQHSIRCPEVGEDFLREVRLGKKVNVGDEVFFSSGQFVKNDWNESVPTDVEVVRRLGQRQLKSNTLRVGRGR